MFNLFQHIQERSMKCLFKNTCMALVMLGMIAMTPHDSRAAPKDVTILGGGTGGMFSIMAEGVGEVIRRNTPDYRVTVEPGKDGPNQVMVSRNQVPLGLGYGCIAQRAIEGRAPYKERFGNLRAVGVVNTISALQFIIDKKTGITSIEQIREKKYPLRVAVNRAGSVMDVAADALFRAYGFTYKDIESWGGKVMKIPGPETMSLWDAGQADAIIEIAQYPTSRFVELSQKHDLILLPIAPDKVETLVSELGMTPLAIEKGSYSFVPDDCLTINTPVVLMTSADVPDELVENVCKAMVAHLDYLRSVHVNLSNLTPEIIATNTLIPLHPAAEAYFKKIGAIK